MTIMSRAVTANYTYADFNLLRSDLLDPSGGHNHDGIAGRKINHSDLVHPSAYAPTNTHQAIDTHIAALHGVHGHPAGMYMLANQGPAHILTGYHDVTVNSSAWFRTTIWFHATHKNAFANTNYIVFFSWETLSANTLARLFAPLLHTKTQASCVAEYRAEREDDFNGTMRLHYLAIGQPVGGWTP